MKFGKNYCRRLARPANKLIISDHYHIAYSCYKDLFTPFIEKTKAPMKGILGSMQPKLTLVSCFCYCNNTLHLQICVYYWLCTSCNAFSVTLAARMRLVIPIDVAVLLIIKMFLLLCFVCCLAFSCCRLHN